MAFGSATIHRTFPSVQGDVTLLPLHELTAVSFLTAVPHCGSSCASCRRGMLLRGDHTRTLRNRRAFPITERELNAIAAAAMIGERSMPYAGYSTPAAIGTPSTL